MLIFLYIPVVHASFWTQSRQLSSGDSLSSDADACSRDDEIYVVWSDNRTGNNEIFFIFSQNAGQSWSSEERLTDTAGSSTQPAIACDRKNLYLAWREQTEDTSRIYYRKWDGIIWGDTILLTGKHNDSQRPEIASTSAFPGSYIYVVWDSEENGKTAAYLTRSSDGGQSFSEPKPLTNGDWNSREPVVWCGARDAYLVWSDNRENGWNIYFKRWGEVLVSPEAKLSTAPDCRSPAISGLEPDIYVSWQCVKKDKVYADIYLSSSSNQGVIWSDALKITKGEAESVFPKLAISDKSPWLFWQDGRNGEWQIFYFNSQNSEALTTADKPGTFPDVVATSGQIHVFWARFGSSLKANIMYIRRDTIPPGRPETPSHFDLTAAPGYDDDNQITFSWKQKLKIEGVVKYNIYSKEDNGDFVLAGSTDKTSFNIQGKNGKVYQVYIQAVDEVGNASILSGISPKVVCDSEPPAVTILSPNPDSTTRGDVPIIASVHDPNMLEYVVEYGMTASPSIWQRLSDPLQKEADRERILTWKTLDLNGIYTLRISARDKAGNESIAPVVVNIDSRPPIAISSGQVKNITDPDAGWNYGTPAWSPRGDRIACRSDEGGTEDIWLIYPDGSSKTRLTRNTSIEHGPAWSPSSDMIAFQSYTEDNLWDIWAIRSDGKDEKKIITDRSSDENPAWSPDGSSIAFDSDRDGDSEIFLLTNVQDVLKGSGPQLFQLTHNNWDDKHPTWSPDGSRIIFQSLRYGNWGLYEIGIDGSNSNVILDTAADEIEPEWSPDRKRLLFSTNESGTHYEIHAINWPDATGQIRLSPKEARHGSWSPAMDSIVYEHNGSLYSTALEYPAENLEAIISRPRTGELIKGEVDIIGTARGNNFQSYKIMYSRYAGEKIDDQVFQLIEGESTAPVIKPGFLGRWYTEVLEGEYLLKLIVISKDGSFVEDSVRVLIANQLPSIVIDEPKNGLVTDKNIINVKGQTEKNVILNLNGIEFYPDLDGSFSKKAQLSEGANKLIIKAFNPSDQSREYIVERTVFLDTKPPVINLESPGDFQVINVPYLTVKGRVDEESEISVLSKRVWPDSNGNFQRKVSCQEGANLISVAAFDKLGHYSSITRRVIFKRETDTLSDFPPAITDVFPDNRAVVTGKNLKISATLIDDVGLDPFNITFTFNGEEMVSEEYDLDIKMPEGDFPSDRYPVIHFSYYPVPPLAQGQNSFKLKIQDTSGNIEEQNFSFSIDSVPSKVLLSAQILDSAKQIRISLASNRQINQIHKANIYCDSFSQAGYSLSSFTKKDGYYETYLSISPSQRNFIIDFSGNTYLGDEISSYGYLAWNKAGYGERVELGTHNGPKFLSDPIYYKSNHLILSLRSQDGINNSKFDASLIELQQEDAVNRRLRPSGLAYILSAPEGIKDGIFQGILGLPASGHELSDSVYDIQRLIMFRWDEEMNQWQPLDRLGFSESLVESQIPGPGIYTLFADLESPVIKDVFPVNFGEAPLERFLIEASISDSGSGVSEIKLSVDGKQVAYDYDPLQGKLLHSLVNLEWGLHKVEITAVDRAGNVNHFSTNFVSQDFFQFTSIRAYPNPARDNVNIEFKLTKLANVALRIYTVTGDLIYDSEMINTADGKLIWKRVNNYGNKVASGVYIYSIEASLYDTRIRKRGAIAVIK